MNICLCIRMSRGETAALGRDERKAKRKGKPARRYGDTVQQRKLGKRRAPEPSTSHAALLLVRDIVLLLELVELLLSPGEVELRRLLRDLVVEDCKETRNER